MTPALLVFTGLPGTGKSTLSDTVAGEIAAPAFAGAACSARSPRTGSCTAWSGSARWPSTSTCAPCWRCDS
jgi:hypothetical protein